jgi:hypothetical protein
MRKRLNHTSYCPSLFRVLAAYEEDHVPLGGIDVVVLKEEDFVNTIFLELNLTNSPIVPAKAFSMTRFFLPLTWSLSVLAPTLTGIRKSYIHLPVCGADRGGLCL